MRRRGWVALLVLLAVVFAVFRGVHALAEEPEVARFPTDRVVVVGLTGHDRLDATDEQILGAHLGDAQVGTMAARARYVGACAAAGWTTLGAGRRAAVAGLCDPQVSDGRVSDWAARLAAAAARNGDARLGTLAASVPGCVAAVGPGAALAAARPDGTVARYGTAADFLAGGLRTSCPLTLVDPGARAYEILTGLARDPSVTLVVTGIGPAVGSQDPALQVVYRLGTTFPGWLTSASTRREGIVTLTDLTRTLVDVADPGGAAPLTVDGSPLAVAEAALTLPAVAHRIAAIRALSDAVVTGYLSLAVGGTVLFVLLVAGILLPRPRWSRLVLTYGLTLLSAMMLAGSLPWATASRPQVAVVAAVWGWSVVLVGLVLALARVLGRPAAVVAAGVALTAYTVDAALGGPLQAGSLINSRPIFALRWYGFGNVTFAGYAWSGLVLGGWLCHRFRLAGRRRAGVMALAVVLLGLVLCEGWPSMGSDFGGVVAFTPPVLWLLLTVAGVRLTRLRLVAVGVAAVLVVTLISVADWARGADQRSHLGNFVQRVLDGDASSVVYRKAVASAETIASPLGLGCLLVGIPLWILMLRVGVPALSRELSTARPVWIAGLATGVLGTLLNDGGISVFLTVTGLFAATTGWWLLDRAVAAEAELRRDGWTAVLGPVPRR